MLTTIEATTAKTRAPKAGPAVTPKAKPAPKSPPASKGSPASPKPAPEPGTRHCSGSKRWGIPDHDAPVADFPKNAGEADGLSKTCTGCNRRYAELKRARLAAAPAPEPAPEPVQAPAKAPAKAPRATKPAPDQDEPRG